MLWPCRGLLGGWLQLAPAAAPGAAPSAAAHPSCLQAFFLARSRVHYTAEALLAPLAAENPDDPDVALVAAAVAQLAGAAR